MISKAQLKRPMVRRKKKKMSRKEDIKILPSCSEIVNLNELTRKNKIRIQCIAKNTGVAYIEENMPETLLKWSDHVRIRWFDSKG